MTELRNILDKIQAKAIAMARSHAQQHSNPDLKAISQEGDDLVSFLHARLNEIETAAKATAAVYPSPWELYDRGWKAEVQADGPYYHTVTELDQNQAPGVKWLGDVLEHIVQHDPARVLADIEAKRLIVKAYRTWAAMALKRPEDSFIAGAKSSFHSVLRVLAQPYANHVDYPKDPNHE